MGSLGRVWRSAASRVREVLRGRELVGTDRHGNEYFRWTETANGETKERRQVKVSKGDIYYDPKDIPSEWRMWLNKSRQDAPTPEELAQSEAKAELMQRRVKALQEQDAIRAFRARAAGGQAPGAASGSYMEQLSSKLQDTETK